MVLATPPLHRNATSLRKAIKGKRKKPKQRSVTWTKRARFPGQGTFDLSNNMKRVPFSKRPNDASRAEVLEDQVWPESSLCRPRGMIRSRCVCDPLMKELHEMQEGIGGGRDHANQDPRMRGLPADSTLRAATWRDHYITQPGEPKSGPISDNQLIDEVKDIYASLVMDEELCMKIKAANRSPSVKWAKENLRALTAGQHRLLHEYHDFLLATHHPLAAPGLRGLAKKYAMPARMWEHGLDGFLKLLRNQMPGTSNYMLKYLDSAYSVLEDLGKHVPSLTSEWAECNKGLDVYRDELQKIMKEEQQLDVVASSSSCDTSHTALDLARSNRVLDLGFQLAQLRDWLEADPDCRAYHRYYTSYPFNWKGSQSTLSLTSQYAQDPCQASSSSPVGEYGVATSAPNLACSAFEWCDEFYSPTQAATASSSASRGSSSDRYYLGNDGQVFNPQNLGDMPDDDMHQRPPDIALSHIAIWVLAGWLLMGQASSLDFNIFVKVFCILAWSDLEWPSHKDMQRSCRRGGHT